MIEQAQAMVEQLKQVGTTAAMNEAEELERLIKLVKGEAR